jgi:hypothetical protein
MPSDESEKHRRAAADHLRKSQKATTAFEKTSEQRLSMSHKTMADNQDWLDDQSAKATSRKKAAKEK